MVGLLSTRLPGLGGSRTTRRCWWSTSTCAPKRCARLLRSRSAAASCAENWARAPRGGGVRYVGGKRTVCGDAWCVSPPNCVVRKPPAQLCTRDHRLLVESSCGERRRHRGTGSLMRRRTGGLPFVRAEAGAGFAWVGALARGRVRAGYGRELGILSFCLGVLEMPSKGRCCCWPAWPPCPRAACGPRLCIHA